ncbi:transporter [Burkholderiaceae bacterium 16]|nr:transporter [Burkholderiaceae bacterium 16]
MPSWPSARQWLFSLKAFAASMLALYIALALGLPRPYWAMATVYFVSHPLTGATRSKAAYRVAGTLLGATAAVVTVPLLVNAPVMLMGAIALWTGALLYLSLLQRTPRSYVFLLAAYTLPIVALPSVSDPAQVFDIAVARIEEIVIGIVCAGMVGAIVFPAKVAPALRARSATWLADAALWATDMLSADPAANATRHGSRHRLAADILALDQLIVQLSYDTESADTLRHARALRERMTMLLPVLSSLAAVLQALRRHAAGIPEQLARHMADMSGWIHAGFDGPRPALEPAAGPWAGYGKAPGWHAGLVATANDHLRKLAEVCEDCHALQRGIGDQAAGAAAAHRGRSSRRADRADRAHHHDHAMLLFYACSTSLAVFCAGMLWIVSGWEDGAGSVAVASIACCFFATIEEPRPVAHSFLRWSCFCFAVSSFYLFLVVPNAHNFETLVGMLAVPYMGIGMLISRPGFNLIAMLLSVNTASFANVQSVYDTNFLGTFNSSLASIGGMLFAPLWAMATRPFGARVAAHRLIRASWKDLAQAATRREPGEQAKLGGRMLDRLSQLVPRLAASDDKMSSDGFAELQVGFGALALQRNLPALRPAARRGVTRVLNAVALHFRARLKAGHAMAPPDALSERIDKAIREVALQSDGAGTLGESARHALAALIALRVTLYPAEQAAARPAHPLPALPLPLQAEHKC